MVEEKVIEVPLSKLNLKFYDKTDGSEIKIGEGKSMREFMFEAWTDNINRIDVISVELPKLNYLGNGELYAKVTYREHTDLKI